ncbi:MAG: universal stress protein [Stellaceae bacterium]
MRLPSTIRSYWLPRPAASARRCDLIVIASHGRRGVSAVVLGSETVKVLTHSKIPVLVYR